MQSDKVTLLRNALLRAWKNPSLVLMLMACLLTSCDSITRPDSSPSLAAISTQAVLNPQEAQLTDTPQSIATMAPSASPSQPPSEAPSPTSLPQPHVITSQNLDGLVEIATWERETYTDFAWAPDGSTIALFNPYEGGIDLYELPSFQLKWSSERWVSDLIFDSDRQSLIAADIDTRSISFLDVADGEASSQLFDEDCGYFPPHELILDSATGILFGGVGLPALGPDRTLVYLWDTQNSKCMGLFVRHRGEFNSLDLSSDGTTLLVGMFDAGPPYVAQVHLWDVASRELKCWFRSEAALIAPGGDYVAVVDHQSESLKFYDPNTCGVMTEFPHAFPHPSTSYELAFSPSGGLLAIGYDSVRVFDTSSRKLLAELAISGLLREIAFSPGGEYLAISECSACTVSLWSATAAEKHP